MLNYGVIGAGRIAKQFCNAVNGINGKLYAVASRSIERAEAYQKEFNFEKAYGSYEELLNDPKVDIVYIATPHGLHYEQMMLILDYKKNILCEKPFTLNAKQAKTVFDKAKKNNCFVMEAVWTRFLPTILEVKQLVEQGIIGEIKEIVNSFGFAFEYGEKGRLYDLKLGAGALLDVGIYPVSFAHLFLGAPSSFETQADMDPNGFDLSEKTTFHYPNAIAHLESSMVEDLDSTAVIKGTKGYIKIPTFWKAEKAYIYDLNDHLIKEISHPFIVNGFEYEIMETYRMVEAGLLESSIMPHSVTLEIMKEMDELRKIWGLKYPQE